MTNIPDRPLATEAAWKPARMARDASWIHVLTDQDVAELEAALARVKARGLDMTEVTRDDFPLPNFAAKLAVINDEIEEGRGFALIRGVPVERLGEAAASIIYWGIGTHFGEAVAQNRMADMVGHVRAQGRDWKQDGNARGYQTTQHLPFHTDKADQVWLLCLHHAKAGGLSCIASSVAIHDEILRTRPDLLELLYQPFCIDHRGEEFDGGRPFYEIPIFGLHRDRLHARYGNNYIHSAQRHPEVPRLTDAQLEAIALFNQLATSDEFRLDMEFRQGDIQMLNNRWMVHSRTEYEDFPEDERRRHLLRLLLFTEPEADRPPFAREINELIRRWAETPREPAEVAVS